MDSGRSGEKPASSSRVVSQCGDRPGGSPSLPGACTELSVHQESKKSAQSGQSMAGSVKRQILVACACRPEAVVAAACAPTLRPMREALAAGGAWCLATSQRNGYRCLHADASPLNQCHPGAGSGRRDDDGHHPEYGTRCGQARRPTRRKPRAQTVQLPARQKPA